ncbi:MAG: hydroxyacid dehydrogenase [Planctomycetota bacterium]|jgi:D-3-phosphoglycerate dehydrogenase|nr:hydroxyacid dehydrogenase [Planctomycetota bacterium]
MATGYRVYIPQDIREEGKAYLRDKGYTVVVGDWPRLDEDELARCDAVLARAATRYDRALLDKAPKLRVIGRYGVGTDNIDLEYCTERGIQVTSALLANMVAVAEHALHFILACAKNAYEIEQLFRCGDSNFKVRDTHCGVELENKTLGIVGLGKIGRKLAVMARGLSMKVIGFDPYVARDNAPDGVAMLPAIEDLLREADFVSLHLPSTPETNRLFDLSMLKKMKPTAHLINCARGGLVVERDLIEALRRGVIAGAGIDVFEREPPAADNPLLSMRNVAATPHMAGQTKESLARMGVHAAMGIDDVLNGREPAWPVNRLDKKK